MSRAIRRLKRLGRVIALAARLSRVGIGLGRAKVFSATLSLGARRLLGRPSERLLELRIRVRGTPRKVSVSDYGELEVMRDILIDEDYALPASPRPDLVLDVGANIGLATLWFRELYPDAEIVAVEPDPATFAKLERNVGGDPRVRVVNAAAGAEAGELTLFRPAGYSIASSFVRDGADGSSVRVRVETLDRLCEELGVARVDLLKLDVEGAEIEALRGFGRLREVRLVRGEAHPELLGERTPELFSLLEGFDVTRLSETDEAISFLAVRG